MPNWCNNSLTLIGSDESLDKLVENYVVKDDNNEIQLDFNKIVPMPVELKGTVSPTPDDIDPELQKTLLEKYGVDNWYDWCVGNWGTKWNSSDTYSNQYGISFTTAWSPPVPVIGKLAQLIGKDLRLTYIEEGMGFCGETIASADGSLVDNEYEIKDAPEDLLNELGYEEWEEEEE
jgi:hypothetical protein